MLFVEPVTSENVTAAYPRARVGAPGLSGRISGEYFRMACPCRLFCTAFLSGGASGSGDGSNGRRAAVIASDIRGVNDLIEHTKGGYLVQGFDPEDYAVKIRRMFTEKDAESAVPRDVRRNLMGEWNKKRVKQFSTQVVDQQMRALYQEVLQEDNAGRRRR